MKKLIFFLLPLQLLIFSCTQPTIVDNYGKNSKDSIIVIDDNTAVNSSINKSNRQLNSVTNVNIGDNTIIDINTMKFLVVKDKETYNDTFNIVLSEAKNDWATVLKNSNPSFTPKSINDSIFFGKYLICYNINKDSLGRLLKGWYTVGCKNFNSKTEIDEKGRYYKAK